MNNSSQNALPQDQGKVISIVSYITIIGTVLAYFLNQKDQSRLASFHIRQSLGITVTGFVLGLLGYIPFIGAFLSAIGGLLVFILWIMGLISAVKSEVKEVPLLGAYYQKWFAQVS